MKCITCQCLLLAAIALVIVGCASMESRWREAKTRDTIAAYESFLRDYPESQYSGAARSRLEELNYMENRESDFQQALRNNTVESLGAFLRKYYSLEKQRDGSYICHNSDFVNGAISRLLLVVDASGYSEEEDTIPMKFHRALEDEGAKLAQQPSPGGLRMSLHNMQVTIEPQRFGGNPAYMITSSPLPQAQTTFRDLHADVFFDQSGLCYKKEARYSRGSLIMLQNGRLYVYDGRRWRGPY